MEILKYLVAFLVCSFGLNAQTTFFKLFSNNGYDYGYDILQNADSSYYLVGSSSSFTESSEGFLAKIDKFGTYQWSKHYGDIESDLFTSINRNSSGELLLSGYSNSYSGNGNYDFVVVKTDGNGNEIDQYTAGTPGWDVMNSGAIDQDDNLYLVGKTFDTGDGKSDMYLVKFNPLGDTLWTKQYSNVGEDELKRIIIDSDSTYIVCGTQYNWAEETNKGYVGRFYQDGTLIWESTNGTTNDCFFNDIVKDTLADTYFCVGRTVLASGDISFYQIKIDVLGNVLLSIEGNEPGIRSAEVACIYTSTNKLLVGEHFDNQYSVGEGYDMFFQQYNLDYNWEGGISHYNNEMQDEIKRLVPTSDLGAIAIGYTTYQGKGGANVFVLKFGPNGEEPVYTNSNVQTIVSVPEIEASNKFIVFPNPASEKMCVSEYKDETLSLYNLNAKLITASKSNCLDVSAIENGVYLLKVSNNDAFFIQKVLIQK